MRTHTDTDTDIEQLDEDALYSAGPVPSAGGGPCSDLTLEELPF